MIKQHKSITIKRSQINLAGYNPRKISPQNRKNLRNNLKTMGLMGGVVWNSVTKNLVSGHQRITILDKEYRYPSNDYDIDVIVVELTEEEEKAQNIFLNNPNGQGVFDTEKLELVMKDINYSEITGFDKKQSMSLFGSTEMLTQEEYEKISQQVSQLTNTFKDMSNKNAETTDFYIVLICKNSADKENIINAYDLADKLDDDRFIPSEVFIEAIKDSEEY